MKQIVEIDLINRYNLIDKYNEKKVSHNLIEYIIKQVNDTNLVDSKKTL